MRNRKREREIKCEGRETGSERETETEKEGMKTKKTDRQTLGYC